MEGKKRYPLRRLVGWYFGNYCARKCFDNNERLFDHHQRLLEFAEKNSNVEMTYGEFLDLFNNNMNLCTLDESFKRRSIGWKLFVQLKDTPNYESDKIIIEKGIIKRKDGLLEKPVHCRLCQMIKSL